MKNKLIFSLILLLANGPLHARDHVGNSTGSTKHSLQYNPLDGTIMSDSKQYPHTVAGLRQYLDQEVTTDSQDYARLDQHLKQLEQQSRASDVAFFGPAGIGLGCIVVGAMLRQDQEPTDPLQKSLHEKGGKLMVYGVGGIAIGYVLSNILAPGDKDIQGFINFHNGQSAQTHTKASDLSLSFLTGNQLVSLQYSF